MKYTRIDLSVILDHAHVCECGALVTNLGKHDKFHESLTPTESEPSDRGSTLQATGHLSSSERRWTPSFGFGLPSVDC